MTTMMEQTGRDGDRHMVVAGAIATAAAVALVNGVTQGGVWLEAAEDIAYWAERGTGSTGWVAQLTASLTVVLAGIPIGFVAGLVIRVVLRQRRGAAALALIGAVSIASMVGFLAMTGVGGAQGWSPPEVLTLTCLVLASTAIGTMMGYAAGSLMVRGSATASPTPRRRR